MNPTRNDLPAKVRTNIAALLNKRLADAIDLQLQAKQAHWNVKGPQFIALHELFDKVAGLAGEAIDEIAERAVQLGGTAEGTLQVVTKASSLAPYPLGITSGPDHVSALARSLADFGRLVRRAIQESTDAGDADTADLFTGISREADKHLWFVEAHLQK